MKRKIVTVCLAAVLVIIAVAGRFAGVSDGYR